MRSFRDVSISYKTLVPPLIVMIALGGALLFTIRGFDKQRDIIQRVNNTVLERSTLLNRFILLSERVQSDLLLASVMQFMGVPDKEVLPVINRLDAGLSNLGFLYHQILSQWSLDKTEKETLKQMKVPLDGFRKQARQSIDTVLKNPSFGILLVRSAAFPFSQFRTMLSKFLEYQKERVFQAESLARQKTDRVKTTASVIAIFAAFMAILVTAWIGRTLISRPVRSITDVMGQLATGNLSTQIGDLGRMDEIGSMARAVEVFRENAIEKQVAEMALRESEERFRLTAEETGQLLYSLDPRTGKVKWAGAVEAVTGYTFEEYESFDVDAWGEQIHPEDREMALKTMDEALENRTRFDMEYRFRRKDGSYIFVEEHGAFVYSEESPYPTVGTISDITDVKQIEKEITEQRDFYEGILEGIINGVWVTNKEDVIYYTNKGMAIIAGIDREQIAGVKILADFPESTLEFFRPYYLNAKETLEPIYYDAVPIITPAGRQSYQSGWLIPRIKDSSFEGMICTVEDVTERRAAEEQIKASLQEKEVLLREVHHRVKNNLQVITSLLRLQSDTIKDQKIADMFKESRERIRSMALIHEKLYRSEDLASINFNGYMKGLITGLFRSHGTDPGRIATRLEVEEVPLGLDQAIPCGLIVNELVSNSLKYAFPKERKGEISVTLRSHGADEVALTVSDDGRGIPENVNLKNADTLGLELVSILAEDQLEGSIDLDRTNGTTFRICFRLQTRRKV
jgi:PAS domain S-box-containing protein